MARCASRVAVVSHWTLSHSREAAVTKSGEARSLLGDLMKKVEGLYAVVITDRDGIPIIRAASEQTPENALKPSFLAIVSLAVDQAGKLGIGKNKCIICSFTGFQVVHFNKCPLMISLIANVKANTGLLLNLEPELSNLVHDLQSAINTI